MPSPPKKVIARRMDPHAEEPLVWGYLPWAGIVDGETGDIALLGLDGRVQTLRPAELRYIAYVRDFNLQDSVEPERLSRRTFLARPRNEGLWIRLKFVDGEVLEGLAPTGLLLLDQLLADRGLTLVPPDTRSNTQRLFIPRAAMAELQLLGVITTPSRQKPEPEKARPATRQQPLFPPAG